MTWDPSPSPDALNCYYVMTYQRPADLKNHRLLGWDVAFGNRYSVYVCGPPFVWDLPPEPQPGQVQYFCLMTRDLSGNFSACADIEFVKGGSAPVPPGKDRPVK